ncbi:MAG: filamentous hemagglutinin family protein, partial [Verrucomicrobiota bacterium]
VYYVERGTGTLAAGRQIKTNATREISGTAAAPGVTDSPTWLPTTLFLGKGGFNISARGDVLLGPVVNPFLLPGGLGNTYLYKTYFSTYASGDYVNVSSIGGSVSLREVASIGGSASEILNQWYKNKLLWTPTGSTSGSYARPWLRLNESSVQNFGTVSEALPPTLRATSFSGSLNLVGDLTLYPSTTGGLELVARDAINGLQKTGPGNSALWVYSILNVSDASPAAFPGIASPFSYQKIADLEGSPSATSSNNFLNFIDNLLTESGATSGSEATLQAKRARHMSGNLHAGDSNPIRIYAGTGDISGLELFSPKSARVLSGRDISDVSFYIQNLDAGDISVVSAGRDILPYNADSAIRTKAGKTGAPTDSLAGDIQISGDGLLEVLAGGNLDLGTGTVTNLNWKITSDDGAKAVYVAATSQKQARLKAVTLKDSTNKLATWVTSTSTIALLTKSDGTGTGITSVGNARNPYLPFEGADIIVGAGLGAVGDLSSNSLDFKTFLAGLGSAKPTSAQSAGQSGTRKDLAALEQFYTILRDAGRDYSDPASRNYLKPAAYAPGYVAIATLFPDPQSKGDILTRSRDIRTKSGGSISIFAPGGGLTMSGTSIVETETPPGIITETGGAVSIFTNQSVEIGIGRIFTLRGGDIMIWSSKGDIAAGASSKTVRSAPPTRVLLDPESAALQTDLAGLATGGGIGVLATVKNVAPGDVDLIAPVGAVDAGDAGIRATGNLNIAAARVLNADNISVGGTKTGVPSAPTVAAPNIGGLTSGSSASAAANTAAQSVANTSERPTEPEVPSIITVEVLGYGGGEGEE